MGLLAGGEIGGRDLSLHHMKDPTNLKVAEAPVLSSSNHPEHSETLNAMEVPNDLIEVTVLYFARARELLGGKSEEKWCIGNSWTTSDLQMAVLARYKQLEDLLRTCAWALNEEYVDGPRELKDNDILALIPPISGG